MFLRLAAMGLIREMEYPGLDGKAPVVDFPVKMSKVDISAKRRAPTLGEHTDELMSELGYSAEQIADLKSKRVI